jgi:hypothetical protein
MFGTYKVGVEHQQVQEFVQVMARPGHHTDTDALGPDFIAR